MTMPRKESQGVKARIVSVIAITMALYNLFYFSHALEKMGIYILSASHAAANVGFILVLVFLLTRIKKGIAGDKIPWYDCMFAFLSALGTGYFFFMGRGMIMRDALPDILMTDLLMGSLTVVLLLEASRRVIGLAMPMIAIFFILETMFSNHIPGLFQGRGFSWGSIVKQLYVWDSGIFGIPMYVASTIVIAFIIFSNFLQHSGAGKFIIDVAFSLFGRFKGGPAKVAIFASALFGTISGSTSANVAGTGVFTIPMMKQVGYKPHFAGAVEAVASNGGQIMPPVMGAVAFIMCEFLQITYIAVCIAALIPAILYFLSVLIMVHLEALKEGLRGLPREMLPSFKKTMWSGWFYLIPILVLIFFLAFLQYSPEFAVLYALGSLFLVGLFNRKSSILQLRKILECLESSGRAMLEVGTACATAGIIIGCIGLSGLGQKLSTGLVFVSGGNLPILLVVTAIAAFILGMGMTSIPIYIMLVILVAPALIQMGVLPLAAHLFVFYWGLVSFITPPVCIAAFVAAAIAGSKPFQTGWQATKLGIASFIIPFFFVYSPVLLLKGPLWEIMQAVTTSTLGIVALSASVAGYGLRHLNFWERSLLFGAAILLIHVGWKTDLLGFALMGIVATNQAIGRRKLKDRTKMASS
jgi:TRAP transporter 4TM/12TM fusion protein